MMKKKIFAHIVIDLSAFALIFFMRDISGAIGLPVYAIEPMRLATILAICHTNRWNAFALALILPVFAFAVHGHPIFPKFLIISLELVLNAYLFFFMLKLEVKAVFAAFFSILFSKMLYFGLFFLFIAVGWLPLLEESPMLEQLILTAALSAYVAIFYRREII